MFDSVRKGFKRARDLFAPLFAGAGEQTPTQNEMRLDVQEFMVKQKLGRNFFTKRLNPNTWHARIASLTHDEWRIAKNKGWL